MGGRSSRPTERYLFYASHTLQKPGNIGEFRRVLMRQISSVLASPKFYLPDHI